MIWEMILFWFVTGSGLVGLPPGDRDPQLISAVPPQTLVYFEWSARGPGQPGGSGIDGFAADPEIRQFFETLDAALKKRKPLNDDETNQVVRTELPLLIQRVIAHPGCLFLGFEPKPLDKNAIENWINRLTGLHGGAILSLGDDADPAWNSLMRILSSMNGFSDQNGSPTQKIPLPFPGYQLFVHREGQRIIFALGDSTLPRTLDGIAGKFPGLDTNPRFRESFQRIAVPRVSAVGWVDTQGIMGTVASVLGPLGALVRPMLSLVGADSLDRVVYSAGVDNNTIIQRKFVENGGRTDGIMVLFAGAPIQPVHLSHVPGDADLVLAASINLTKIYQEARLLLLRTNPLSVRVFDEAVKQLESELELKIVDDVLPAFGNVVTAFDSPSAGGMIATSLVASVEVQDHKKASVVFDRLLKLSEQSLTSESGEDESPTIHRQQFLGRTIYFLNQPGPGYGVHFTASPTFCLTERHLLFAVHPQAMKSYLRFVDSQKQITSLSRPASFDQVANRKVPVPEGDVLTYCYLNGPRANGLLSTILPYLSPTLLMQLESEGVSMDSFSVPSAAAITPFFGDSTAVLVRQKNGLLLEMRNAPPVIVSLALLSMYQRANSDQFEILDSAIHRRGPAKDRPQLNDGKDQVVPAVAKTNPAAGEQPKSNPSMYRKLAPVLLKALIPNEAQSLIPDSVYQKLEEGPSPDALRRREEARQKREDARRRREERRRPPPPDR